MEHSYKLDNGVWSEWQEGETCRYIFNGLLAHTEYTIHVEVKDNAGNVTIGTIKTTIVDNVPPVIDQLNKTSTTDSITVTGTVTEQESGIKKCEFSIDNGVTWVVPNNPTDTSYTFNGLTHNKTYNIIMKVTDNEGNQSQKSISATTGKVPGLTEANISLNPNTTTLTKGNVIVTITYSAGTPYTIQYTNVASPQASDWQNYTGPLTMTQNGVVHARLIDRTGNVGDYTTANIVNIDKLPPKAFTSSTLTATTTSNSITVNANTTDQERTSQYACSGIAGYNFSINNGASWTGWQTSGQYTFQNLTPANYTIKVKAKDRVGNEIEGSITKDVVSLSLSSTSGSVLSGNSINVTVNGANYGTLSCTTANGSIATAEIINGNILKVTGKSTTQGNQSTTITVRGNKGGSATYRITSHVHQGNSSSQGGCYNVQHSETRTCGNALTPKSDIAITECSAETIAYTYSSSSHNDGSVTVKVEYKCTDETNCGRFSYKLMDYPASETWKLQGLYEQIQAGNVKSVCPIKVYKPYTYYTCSNHGGSYSSSTETCTSKVPYTYYTTNCGY